MQYKGLRKSLTQDIQPSKWKAEGVLECRHFNGIANVCMSRRDRGCIAVHSESCNIVDNRGGERKEYPRAEYFVTILSVVVDKGSVKKYETRKSIVDLGYKQKANESEMAFITSAKNKR